MKLTSIFDHIISAGILIVLISMTSCGQIKTKDTALESSTTKTTTSKTEVYKNFFTQLHARGQFNGNALIVEKGTIVYQGAFGIRNIDPVDSLQLNSVFRLGSVSKQFTAMAVMILKEQGTLTYEQDIRDFIPELPYKGITIRHLLHHVSGLPDETQLMNEHWKVDVPFDAPEKHILGNEDIINTFVKVNPPVHFKPMEKWEYSNTGYMLLATIVSKASGMPFEDFLDTYIFKPLHMKHTVVYDYVEGPDPFMPNRAYGFKTPLNGMDMTSTDSHYLNAAQGEGGVYSTLEDLYKWDRALYTETLVSKTTLNEAFLPLNLSNDEATRYGFGWFLSTSPNGKKVVQHGGAWAGFITNIYREIEEDNSIILLTNNSTNYYEINRHLVKIMHNQNYWLPRIHINEVIGKAIETFGIDAAISLYHELRAEQPGEYRWFDNELERLGRELLAQNHIDDAIAIFRLNMEQYPKFSNTYSSLGDGYLAKGDTTNALTYYKKTIAMSPGFSNAQEKIDLIEGVK